MAQDERLRWPDSFAEDPDGKICVTGSHIEDSAWFNPQNGPVVRAELCRIDAG